MRILLTHRYFWPDTPPYAAMLRTIADHLAAEGHEVHVLSSKPSYRQDGVLASAPARERLGQVSVRRIWVLPEGSRNPAVRGLNAVLYAFALFFTVLRLRPDLVTASTFPPFVAGWAAGLAARLTGARFVYHMMDIHPEVSHYSGGRLGRGWLFRALRWLDQRTLKHSSAAVVLSEDMAATLRARPGGAKCPIRIINNFALDTFEAGQPAPTDLAKAPDRFRVIFAGNLGRFQNLPRLTEGIGLLFDRHPRLELFFLGDGLALAELKNRWGDHPQVRFGSFLPFAQAKALIAEADIGLVSLSKDIFRVAYPSKMLTYLGLGVPVLAYVEPQSALATEISDNDLGVVPKSATPEGIAEALEQFLLDPARLQTARAAAADYYARELSQDAVLKKWIAILEDKPGSGEGLV